MTGRKTRSPCSPNGRAKPTRRTIVFKPGDLISVPFPHVERRAVVRRPALVLARRDTDAIGALLWTLMITNVTHAGWAGDIVIPDAERLGLVIPSKIRTAKVSTIEESAATMIGRLDAPTWATVVATVRGAMHAT